MKKFLIAFFFTTFSICISAQESCKVLAPNLSGEYIGICKKGIANGKGIATGIDKYDGNFKDGLPDGKGFYTWESGATYVGEWKEGKRNGYGTYISAEQDSTLTGIWKDDKFIEKKFEKPKIIRKENVVSVSFKKVSDTDKKISINITQRRNKINNINGLTIISSSGSQTTMGNTQIIENVNYPLLCKITFETIGAMSKISTSSSSRGVGVSSDAPSIQVLLEFEISEPGEWNVNLDSF